MISLRKREHISIDSVKVLAPTEVEKPGVRLPGLLLAALFILSFCCRYCQTSLLSSIQFAAPAPNWSPPDAILLLVPAALVAIPIGYLCDKAAKSIFVSTLMMVGCSLATINVLLGYQIAPRLLVALGIVILAGGLEIGRISILSQVATICPKRSANVTSTYIMLVELAASAAGINGFKQFADLAPAGDCLRIASLVLIGFALLFVIVAKQERLDPGDRNEREPARSRSAFEQMKIYPLIYIGLAVATSGSVMTLFTLTLAGKVVASVSLFTLWSAAALGMLFGSFICLIPSSKLQSSRYIIAIALAASSSALCIFKPAGHALFAGLFLSGVAVMLANVTCCSQILKLRYPNLSGLLFGCQAALGCIVTFMVTLVLEPKIESLSSFVFLRVLAISQLLMLIGFGGISYIIFKYRRMQA